MALAIDASTPAVATSNNATQTQTATTASFTPPANSLLVVIGSGNSVSAVPVWTITDNLATHLTYTQRVLANSADTPSAQGSVIIWTAPVSASAAMTVSVTNNSGAGATAGDLAAQVVVMTDSGTTPTVGANGKAASTTSGTAVSCSYTATATGSWGVGGVNDWNATGTMTAGTGCTAIGTPGTNAGNISYGFFRRTTADGVSGSATTLAATLAAASTAKHIAAVEIKGTAAASPAATQLRAPYRRRGGLPPRQYLGRRARSATPVPVQVTPVSGVFVSAQPRRDKFARALPVLRRRPVSVDVAAMAQATPLAKPRMPRRRRLPYLQGGSTEAAPPQLTPPRPRSVARMRRWVFPRTGATQVTPPASAPLPPPITQTTTGRVRRVVSGLRRGESVTPVATQQAPAAPSYPLAYVRGLRRVLVPVRRPRAAGPVHGQSVAPSHNPPQARRRVEPAARRSRSVTAAPPQAAAPTNPAVTQLTGRERLIGRIKPRGKVAAPAPAQQTPPAAPPITQTAARGRRFATLARRGRPAAPTPAQQAPPTNPPITQTATRGRRFAVRARRGAATAPVPPQVVPAAPLYAPQGRRVPRPALPTRRGRAVTAAPPQAAPPAVPAVVRRRIRGALAALRRGKVAVGRLIGAGAPPYVRPGNITGADRATPTLTVEQVNRPGVATTPTGTGGVQQSARPAGDITSTDRPKPTIGP